MPFEMTFSILGSRRAISRLRKLPAGLHNKGLRQGMSAAAGVLKKAAKPAAPKETGLLRQSFRVKVVKPRDRRFNLQARVQPKSKKVAVARFGGKARRLTAKRSAQLGTRREQFRNPIRYAHLVELGHRKRGGRGRVDARNFMKRSFVISRKRALDALTQRIKKFIASVKP